MDSRLVEFDLQQHFDESDRSFGGNWWPRQETVAVLKIRSDMDVAIRDASVKGPLWEEVSRKNACSLSFARVAQCAYDSDKSKNKFHLWGSHWRHGDSLLFAQ